MFRNSQRLGKDTTKIFRWCYKRINCNRFEESRLQREVHYHRRILMMRIVIFVRILPRRCAKVMFTNQNQNSIYSNKAKPELHIVTIACGNIVQTIIDEGSCVYRTFYLLYYRSLDETIYVALFFVFWKHNAARIPPITADIQKWACILGNAPHKAQICVTSIFSVVSIGPVRSSSSGRQRRCGCPTDGSDNR